MIGDGGGLLSAALEGGGGGWMRASSSPKRAVSTISVTVVFTREFPAPPRLLDDVPGVTRRFDDRDGVDLQHAKCLG